METRLKELRKFLDLSQAKFAEKIKLPQSSYALLEIGKRNIKDIHVAQVCSAFNVNEDWLRHGQGEMFVQSDTFSLDDYAKQHNLSDLELKIIRSYMELDKSVREALMDHFKTFFSQQLETAASKERYIRSELDSYEQELRAVEKGGQTLLASVMRGGKSS